MIVLIAFCDSGMHIALIIIYLLGGIKMYTGQKFKIHSKSFHHRIRNSHVHYVDTEQFLGIDPFDKSKFHQVYEMPIKKDPKKET